MILSNMARRLQTLTAIALAAFALYTTAKPIGMGHKNATGKRAISSIVTGTPMGFASATTGGGTATPVYPSTIDELKAYLTSNEPQNIVISGTFNFQGSEGSLTEAACNAYSCTPSEGGQALLNTLGGCGSLSTYDVTIDAAAYNPIWVASDKTLVGMNNAVLYGKGLYFSGVSNIIIQNVAITNLNPAYVWGGDAIAVTGSSNIWFDHIAVSFI
jgi:pectin lyase